jgi:type IV pilus assembly protein PilB
MSQRIIEIIRKANLLSKDDFAKALEFSVRDNFSFAHFLLKNSMVTEAVLMPILEEGLGTQAVDLDSTDIEPAVIDCMPKEVAMQFRIVPINRIANNLIVAGGDPTNLEVIDKLSARLSSKVKIMLASELAIQRALEKYYVKKADSTKASKAAAAAELSDNYVSVFVERLLQTAAQRRVSDIHIEPFESAIRIRLRSDGSLVEYSEKARIEMKDAIASRIKIISNLDIAEKRLPQDGACKIEVPGAGKVDFRVSVLPCVWGEKIVMRILDKSNLQLDMTRLGFEPEQLNQFKESIMRPFGMVLVTGPTGSGKTTTLYSALNELNRVSENVVTAEDPVEFTIPGINQVQVRNDINFTFAKALKSFLRQDPDVIMVGEIRDIDTAEIAMKAALTGHIVLSTLHTNNAAETIERIKNMGIEPFTIISALNSVVAQRLVRKVCNNCKVEDKSHTKDDLIKYGLPEKYVGAFPLYKGEGCEICNDTGYKGRIAIHEVLVLNDAIKKAIAANAPAHELKRIAMQNGMQTLRQSAWKKVAKGLTSIEELLDNSSSDAVTSQNENLKRSA